MQLTDCFKRFRSNNSIINFFCIDLTNICNCTEYQGLDASDLIKSSTVGISDNINDTAFLESGEMQ